MEKKNIQLSWSARDLTRSSPPYPTRMVYKLHPGGVATAQYAVTLELWMWLWRARVGAVPDVHKEGVSDPSILANKCIQIIKDFKIKMLVRNMQIIQ
jgi:hypothetical protein